MKNLKAIMCVLAVTSHIGFVTSVGFAQITEIPSKETLESWKEFKEKYGQNWLIKWRNYIDAPAVIHGYYSLGRNVTDKGDAENISWAFIEDNKDLFKIDLSSLKLSRVQGDWNEFQSWYSQYYNDIPVELGIVRVSIRKDGVINYLSNHFYPDISISTTPVISKNESIAIAKDYFTSRNPGVDVSLVILPSDYIELGKVEKSDTLRYYLTWKVKFHEKTIYVDAKSGDVIFEYGNIVISAGDAEPASEANASESIVDDEQNGEHDKPLQTGTTLTPKPKADKSVPQETPRSTGKRIAIFAVILAGLSIVLILWRWRK